MAAALCVANCVHASSAGSQARPPVSDTITLETRTGKIAGTLLLPASGGPAPLVIIIAGSGPTDRNGNSPLIPGANNSLKMLAEGLAERGIASLRYDKRGIGGSAAAAVREADLRFDTYADDAAAWIRLLRRDRRFPTITIAGHSEGSLLGMLAVQRAPTDAYVSIAGAGRAVDKVLREQLGRQLTPELLAAANRALDTLRAGRAVDTVPQALATLFRSSVQPYLISWLRIDPQVEVARLNIPVLIAHGSLDGQVPPSEAQLLARAQPKAKLLIVEGMNHVLKRAPADSAAQRASYGDPSLPVPPELIDGIAAFVKSVSTRR